jgi:hypothetical protein
MVHSLYRRHLHIMAGEIPFRQCCVSLFPLVPARFELHTKHFLTSRFSVSFIDGRDECRTG